MKQLLKKTYYVPKPYEKEVKGRINWGLDNLYPQWLNWLYYTSAVHQGIVNGKVFYTTSAGLNTDALSEDAKKITSKFEYILPEMSKSLEISNSYYLKCRLSLDKTRVENVEFISFEKVRATEDAHCFHISDDWSARSPVYTELKSYEEVIKSEDRTDLWFILAFKRAPMQFQIDGRQKKVNDAVYSVVPYSGAINSILTDIEISNYQLAEVVNNFSLGTILSLNNGKPKDDADANAIINRVSDETTGSDNAGGVMVLFSNGKETEPTVLHLNGNQLHERYLSLSRDVRDNIMKGHSVVSGELFGFMNEGNFNAATIDWAFFIMKNNYFKQRRNELMFAIEQIFKINNIDEAIDFNEIELPTNTTATTSTEVFTEKKKDATEDEILEAFSKVGIDRADREILLSEDFDLDNTFTDIFTEKNKFADLSAIQFQVVSLLFDGNSFEAISKALDIKPADLVLIFQKLIKAELIDKDGELTRAGRVEVIRSQVERLEVRYSYEVKPGYGAKKLPNGRTRSFCAALVDANRLYLREEIDQISQQIFQKKDAAWMYRGGWYHNPRTAKNEPACRHYWKQNVIYR